MEALMLDFAREVAMLKRTMMLRGEGGILCHAEGPSLLEDLDAALSQLNSRVAACEKNCEEEEAALETGKAMLQQVQTQGSRMEYNLANLPDRVPGNLHKGQTSFADLASSSQPLKTINGSSNNTTSGNGAKESKIAKPKSAKNKAKISAIVPPTIAYVKADEFESIPKYVRGRLTQADVNSVVDALQATFAEKYRLLALPRQQLSDAQSALVSRFQEQASVKTDGLVFVTDEDLRTMGTCKFDRGVQNALTTLRCLGRIKEVREGGVLRYAMSLQ